MIKKVYSVALMVCMCLALVALCLPCLLVFSVGNDGEPTVWNLVGLVWFVGLYAGFKKWG